MFVGASMRAVAATPGVVVLTSAASEALRSVVVPDLTWSKTGSTTRRISGT